MENTCMLICPSIIASEQGLLHKLKTMNTQDMMIGLLFRKSTPEPTEFVWERSARATISKKNLETFLEREGCNVISRRFNAIQARVSFCIGDEFICENVKVALRVNNNIGMVRLPQSRMLAEYGFPKVYDTRGYDMKVSERDLIILGNADDKREIVIWIRRC